jgi:uncharacterized protein YcsI (UPF0317 family)
MATASDVTTIDTGIAARDAIRAGRRIPTGGWAPGYVQANVAILPKPEAVSGYRGH